LENQALTYFCPTGVQDLRRPAERLLNRRLCQPAAISFSSHGFSWHETMGC
jgi:hypothetical protein